MTESLMITAVPERTTRCIKCGRAVCSGISRARRYGSGCRRFVEAVARELDAVGTTPATKAADALRDGAAVLTGHPYVYRFVSSDGTRVYLTHPNACTCPAGIRSVFCYHRIVVSVLSGVWPNVGSGLAKIRIGRRPRPIQPTAEIDAREWC